MERPYIGLECERKVPWDTYDRAYAEACRMLRQEGRKVFPYKCKCCGLWHTSKSDGEERTVKV